MARKPNTTCCLCEAPIYVRPHIMKRQNNNYCSKRCSDKALGRSPVADVECEICSKSFRQNRRTQKFCSRECSNCSRSGSKYSKDSCGNKSRKRLDILKNEFDFNSCMVQGCSYNKLYDVHRLVLGKNGGEYEIGNMFAICPNHHREHHAGLIEFDKISNCELKIRE